MRLKHVTVVSVFVIVLCLPALAQSEPAAEAFAKGESLLLKGDFDAALSAYADAVRGDRANQEYTQHYAMLRRVMQLRAALNDEKDAERWEGLARSLHAFYVGQKIFSEALVLSQQMHARLNNGESAAVLGEAQLVMGLNDEAVKTLEGLDAGSRSSRTESLLGIALNRVGQTDRAQAVAASVSLPESADVQTLFAAARLYAAVGENARACDALAQCLASVPPSRQQEFAEFAKQSPEFAVLVTAPEFDKAIKTESKIPESKCSGGSSCAGCPMRGNCPASQAK